MSANQLESWIFHSSVTLNEMHPVFNPAHTAAYFLYMECQKQNPDAFDLMLALTGGASSWNLDTFLEAAEILFSCHHPEGERSQVA
ncbi:MAG: hypothetical protein NTV87_05850 [Ignavibacteriae bacterium]|nr:hypothetical protein [Ignavibacteriota bacterium]